MTTYEDHLEARRTSVGAKVMIFALAIFAVLGAFWAIVWFIRSYVEQPRISLAAPVSLAARESRPAAPPADPPAPPPVAAAPEPVQATEAAPPALARLQAPVTPQAGPAVTAQTAPPAQ